MNEKPPPLVRALGDDQPMVATLDWEGGTVRWVTVESDWCDQVGPAGLIGQVRKAYQAAQPAVGGNWRLEVSLGDVELEDLKEFNLLLQEARASDPVGRGRGEPQVVRSAHLESHWSAEGGLVRIADPQQWLPTATRQAVCEELTAVLQRPDVDVPLQTPEVRRLLAFAGRKGAE